MTEVLKVLLWGQEIGRLAWHDARKTSFFMYNPEFLKGTLDIAPLAASIHNPLSTRAIFGEAERIYQKLPSFIADSLPDAWGNMLFEQWRRDNRLTERNVTSIEKLAFIGKRGMGALEFVPEIKRGSMTGQIDIKALADLAEKIALERGNVRILPDESLTLQSLIAVGTSAGGRQPKGIIAIDRKTGVIRSGQIDVEPNLDYYILKFGDKARSTAELEQTYYEMALAAGINMMESRLLEVDGTNHFLTKRFDRNETGKLHTQTLAAMDPEADTYEKLFAVCRKLHLPEVDCQELYRRMVFNILANNTDDHNKNFTFIMDRQGTWRLSPAYDMTYIFDTGGYLPNKDHCLMIGGKLQGITRDDAVQFARDNGIRRPDAIIRDVVASLKQFRFIATKYGVSDEWTGRVETTIIDHLKAWGEWDEFELPEFTMNGHSVSNIRMEQAYKGNYHLLADIDGKERKFVIGKNKEEFALIEKTGIANLTPDQLQAMVEKYFFLDRITMSSVVIAIFLLSIGASFVQRTTGFGFGIFIMTMLPFFLPTYGEATTLSGLLAITTSAVIVWRMRSYVIWKRLWPILLTFIVVSTIAIFALTHIEDHILRRILGVALIVISIYFALFSQKIKLPTTKRVQVGAGTLSGLMGGFFGMQGPPAVLYFIQSEPSKEHYMAMTQTYFLIGNVMMTFVRAYNGFFTTTVLTDNCFGLGGVIIGTTLGAYVFKRIPNRIFHYIVYAYIAISGVIILMTN